MPKHRLLTAALLATAFVPAAHALDLTIEVVNPKVQSGALFTSVYSDEAGWMKTEQARAVQRAEVSGERTRLVYRDLPAGRYAVSMFHDENGNGQLDKNVLGMPRERVGFTRDARGTMGPPSFGDAAVDLQQDTTLVITLY